MQNLKFNLIVIVLLLISMMDATAKPQSNLQSTEIKSTLELGYVPGELIVKFRHPLKQYASAGDTGIKSIDELNKAYKITSIERVFKSGDPGLSRIYKIMLPENSDILDVVVWYSKDPNVLYAEPNHIARVYATPNDPSYSQQWAHPNTQADDAWDIETGETSVVIAIVDTGVDWDHPDLAANIWSNAGEIADNGVDDDGNGYIDDVRGWDFTDISGSCDTGEDCQDFRSWGFFLGVGCNVFT